MITREMLCEIVKDVYGDVDKFLDDVEEDCVYRFNVYCTINESPGNGDILILDNHNLWYVGWYKLSHLGRDLHTNMERYEEVLQFISDFKKCKDQEREEE